MSYPNLWIRASMRLDGYKYYEMLLVYVDDNMFISNLDNEVSKQIIDFY